MSIQAFKNFDEVQRLFNKLPPFQEIILKEQPQLTEQPQFLKSFPSCINKLTDFHENSLIQIALQAQIPLDNFIKLLTTATELLKTEQKSFLNPEKRNNTSNVIVSEKAIFFDQNAILHVIGDQHGSFHDTVNFFKTISLKNNETPFEESSFRLKPEYQNHHWIFCGDLTDGGIYGAETIGLILSIFIENPNNIHIVRGNHEDIEINNRYGFSQEINIKYQKNKNNRTEEIIIAASLKQVITKFYDALPVALWGVFPTKKISSNKYDQQLQYHVTLFCHGCIETQDRNIADLCKRSIENSKKIAYKTVNGSFTDLSDIGYLWNDINPDVNEKATKHSGRGPNCYILSLYDIEQYIKKEFENTEFFFQQVFRAHQHQVAYRDLMPIFFQNNGVCILNHLITTLLVMPGTFAGIPIKNNLFPGVIEAVPVILTMNETFNKELIINSHFIALPNNHIPNEIFKQHNNILKEIGKKMTPKTKHELSITICEETFFHPIEVIE